MFYDDEVDSFDRTSSYYDPEHSEKKGGFIRKLLNKISFKSEVRITNAPEISIDISNDFSTDNGNVVTGPAGRNVTYKLTGEWDKRTLTISGRGPMEDYEEDGTPWEEESYNINTIIVEDGVTSIGDHAFDGCSCAISIALPDTVTRIGKDAFCACYKLKSIVIPDSVTEIGDNAFFSCDDLKEVTIPKSVKKLGIDLFSCCDALETIRIEADIDYLPEGTAYSNESLKEIWLPAVSEIDELGIGDCPELTDIYYAGTEEQWKKTGFGVDDDEFDNVTIRYSSDPGLTQP